MPHPNLAAILSAAPTASGAYMWQTSRRSRVSLESCNQTDRLKRDRRAGPGSPSQTDLGSQARGEAASDSDLDIMVVEEKPANRFAEIVRLNRLLRSFDMAIDLLVVSDANFQYWRDTPGNVYYEAATEGQVLYEAA